MTETETKWTELVRGWRASGQTARAFADGKGFKPTTLTYWASVLRRSSRAEPGVASKGEPRVRMVRVVRQAATTRAPEDSVVVALGAARVVVRKGFDPCLLREVVEALWSIR
jgi:hypothetical protein